MLLATSRFHAADLIKQSGLVAIAVVQKPPSWPLTFPLAGNVHELAPPYSIWHLPPEPFTRAYRHQLQKLGVDRITGLLSPLIDAAGLPGAVLLCFEDVTKGELCHRRVFADWWEDKTGIEVSELGVSS